MKSLKQYLTESGNPNLSVISRINTKIGQDATTVPSEMNKIARTKEYKWVVDNLGSSFNGITADKTAEERIIGGFIHWLALHTEDADYSDMIETWMEVTGMTDDEDKQIETLNKLYAVTKSVYGTDLIEYLE